jgi:hypothetical protein
MLLLLTLRITLPPTTTVPPATIGWSGLRFWSGRSAETAAAAAVVVVVVLRGLRRGGLSPAYFAGSTSPFSIFCDACIICSKMARVGERHAVHVHEELPAQGGESPPFLPPPPRLERGSPPRRRPSLTLKQESAKLTCAAGVLVGTDIASLSLDDDGAE